MEIFYKKLSKKIKSLRERLGLSQESLATKIGISRVAISQIENDKREISAEEIVKLSKVFNMPTDILLDLDKDIFFNCHSKGQMHFAVILSLHPETCCRPHEIQYQLHQNGTVGYGSSFC